MAKFIYKAKKGPDEILEGVIETDSEQMAANKLTIAMAVLTKNFGSKREFHHFLFLVLFLADFADYR